MNFDTDIATVIISLIALVLSVITYIKNFIMSFEHYTVEILDYGSYHDTIQLYLRIHNRSSKHLYISEIFIDSAIPCELEPKLISITPSFTATTPLMPICIEPNAVSSYYFEFLDYPDIPLISGTTLSLQIHTNRSLQVLKLLLPNKGRYLNNI